MTIRERLKRRATLFLLPVFIFSMAMIAVGAFADKVLIDSMGPYIFIGFLISFIPILFFFRCPSCTANLGALITNFGPLSSYAKKVNHCPFCGVALDENVVQ
jgi:hypothetical protein